MLENPSEEDLKELGRIVRHIHKSDVKMPKNNFRRRVQSYLRDYNDKGIRVPEIDNNYREMTKLISRMNNLNPCHNDLWHENIIKDKNGKIWLVDWEYSTMGDKHFDLAFFIKSLRLNEKQERTFLESYNSFDDYQAYIDDWMLGYKRFTAWLTCLWAHAQPTMPFDLTWIKAYLNETK